MANVAEHKAAKAHSLVDRAIQNGDLIRANKCELCDSVASEDNLIVAHHHKGYNDPLDIWWVCHSCNMFFRGKHDGLLTKDQAREVVSQREIKPADKPALKVADILKARKRRFGSYHTFSLEIHPDLLSSTLRSTCQGYSISLNALRKIGPWAVRNNDKELLIALVSYILGFEVGDVCLKKARG